MCLQVLEELKKQRARFAVQEEMERHRRVLEEAASDPEKLKVAIPAAAAAIGSAHPAVESARQELQRMRDEGQRKAFAEVCAAFEAEMSSAVSANDEISLMAAIQHGRAAGIGKGHPLMLMARKELEDMRKRQAREELSREQAATCAALSAAMECPRLCRALDQVYSHMDGTKDQDPHQTKMHLQAATEAAELEALALAARRAQDSLGPHHHLLSQARSRHKELRDALGRALWVCEEEIHITAIHAAFDDEACLDAAVRAAALSPLGPAHDCVEQGKKRVRELKRIRVAQQKSSLVATVHSALYDKLHAAESAVNRAQAVVWQSSTGSLASTSRDEIGWDDPLAALPAAPAPCNGTHPIPNGRSELSSSSHIFSSLD